VDGDALNDELHVAEHLVVHVTFQVVHLTEEKPLLKQIAGHMKCGLTSEEGGGPMSGSFWPNRKRRKSFSLQKREVRRLQ
jgi:hypothetical protein